MATGSRTGEVRVWDLSPSVAVVISQAQVKGEASSLAWNPNANQLAVMTQEGHLSLWHDPVPEIYSPPYGSGEVGQEVEHDDLLADGDVRILDDDDDEAALEEEGEGDEEDGRPMASDGRPFGSVISAGDSLVQVNAQGTPMMMGAGGGGGGGGVSVLGRPLGHKGLSTLGLGRGGGLQGGGGGRGQGPQRVIERVRAPQGPPPQGPISPGSTHLDLKASGSNRGSRYLAYNTLGESAVR